MVFDPKERELAIPSEIYGDENPLELLRAWAAHEQLFVRFNPTSMWKEPDNWGVFLVDIARHVARAFYLENGTPEEISLARIRASINSSWDVDEPSAKTWQAREH